MFQVSDLEREGQTASIAISNEKVVRSKEGREWALLRLLTTGTAPHPIVGAPLLAFEKDGRTIFAHRVRHPGTEPNEFVSEVAESLDVQARLVATARSAVARLVGGA
jgi:hypothetical protein